MSKWEVFWRRFDWAARMEVAGNWIDHLSKGLGLDWRAALYLAASSGGGLMTFLWAAIEGKSPSEVWVMAVMVSAALVALIFFAFLLIDRFRGISANADRDRTIRSKPIPLSQQPPDPSTGEVAPNFQLLLLSGDIFILEKTPDLTGVAVNLRIWNLGMPSAAHSWELAVKTEDGKAFNSQSSAIPTILWLDHKNLGGRDIRLSDSMEEKTKTRNIGRTPIEGRVLFYVNLDKASLANGSTELTICVRDIYGKEATASKKSGDWLRRDIP